MMIKENRSGSKELGVPLAESTELEHPETVDTRRQLLDPPTTSLLKVRSGESYGDIIAHRFESVSCVSVIYHDELTAWQLTATFKHASCSLNREGCLFAICDFDDAVVEVQVSDNVIDVRILFHAYVGSVSQLACFHVHLFQGLLSIRVILTVRKVSGSLSHMSVKDQSPMEHYHQDVVSIAGDHVMHFVFRKYDPKFKGFPGFGSLLQMRVNSIQVVLAQRFFLDVADYFEEMNEMQKVQW